MHLRYNEHPNLERLNSISTGFYTQHVQNLLTAFKYSKEIIYNYGIFHWNIFYTSVYMCTNIIGTHFPWLYLEDEMCTLYSGKYSKNSTLQVIQQSHSLLQFSQWFSSLTVLPVFIGFHHSLRWEDTLFNFFLRKLKAIFLSYRQT